MVTWLDLLYCTDVEEDKSKCAPEHEIDDFFKSYLLQTIFNQKVVDQNEIDEYPLKNERVVLVKKPSRQVKQSITINVVKNYFTDNKLRAGMFPQTEKYEFWSFKNHQEFFFAERADKAVFDPKVIYNIRIF